MRTASVRKCSQTQVVTKHPLAFHRRCGMPKSNPPARADDRGGQRVLHRAGVEDADDVAGPGRRERAEERPVHPILTVQLDDLRTHPRKSRYPSVIRGADRNKSESNQTRFS